MLDKITPPNWYATGEHVQSATINEDNYICKVEGRTHEEIQANVNLIAAAPELLKALELAVTVMRDRDIDESMAGEFCAFTDAISKTTGIPSDTISKPTSMPKDILIYKGEK